jgi:hypothetical protein
MLLVPIARLLSVEGKNLLSKKYIELKPCAEVSFRSFNKNLYKENADKNTKSNQFNRNFL